MVATLNSLPEDGPESKGDVAEVRDSPAISGVGIEAVDERPLLHELWSPASQPSSPSPSSPTRAAARDVWAPQKHKKSPCKLSRRTLSFPRCCCHVCQMRTVGLIANFESSTTQDQEVNDEAKSLQVPHYQGIQYAAWNLGVHNNAKQARTKAPPPNKDETPPPPPSWFRS